MSRMFRFLFMGIALAAFMESGGIAVEPTPYPLVQHFIEREYGYFIGDPVKVIYRVSLPKDQYLSDGSLPAQNTQIDERVDSLDRRIMIIEGKKARVYEIQMIYQVFSASMSGHILEIPKIPFSYGPRGNPEVRIDSLPQVPLVISSLTSPQDQYKPFLFWIWKSPTDGIIRNGAIALLLSSMGAFLIWIGRGVRMHSPFRFALRRLSREKDSAAALMIFRSALNEKAGKAIFATNLGEFFRSFPQARSFERDMQRLLFLSDEISFNPEKSVTTDGIVRQVSDTMKKLKRVESWA